jgi:flagellar basal body P-ring formation protein FlgA
MLRLALPGPGGPAAAESLVATRTIRAKSLIAPEDLTLVSAELPGALTTPPRPSGLRRACRSMPAAGAARGSWPADLVERNQLVTLVYVSGGLAISTEGRALARGSAGDRSGS